MGIYKGIIALLLLVFSIPDLSAQDTVLTFYNKELQLVRKKKEDGFYIKSVENGKFHYKENRTGRDILQTQEWDTIEGNGLRKSHYIEYASGMKVQEGNYLNNVKNGIWTSWYQNGSKKEEAEYVDGIKHGKWSSWHENHRKNSIGWYIGDLKSGLWQSWFENGQLSSIVMFEDKLEGMISEITSDSFLYKAVKHNEGLLNGSCYWFLPSGDTAAVEIYEKGRLATVFLFDSLKKKDRVTAEKYEIMKKAAFNGDINGYLKASIKYPERVGDNSHPIQGKAIVEFIVTKDGSVEEVRLVMSSGFFELDREVIRVVNETNGKWSPGLFHNVPKETKYLLPVTFKPGL